MLDIRIDMVPYGFESQRRNLTRIKVVNNGTGSKSSGNYIANVSESGVSIDTVHEGFDRNKPAWVLLKEILNSIDEEDFETKLIEIYMNQRQQEKENVEAGNG